MNVLLAEANVPYDKLFDMDDINADFARRRRRARHRRERRREPGRAATTRSSPIYGMPIFNVDQAQSVIVLKRSMNPGFAGIENELFYNPKCSMLFGNAKDSLVKLVTAVKSV